MESRLGLRSHADSPQIRIWRAVRLDREAQILERLRLTVGMSRGSRAQSGCPRQNRRRTGLNPTAGAGEWKEFWTCRCRESKGAGKARKPGSRARGAGRGRDGRWVVGGRSAACATSVWLCPRTRIVRTARGAVSVEPSQSHPSPWE